MNFEMEQEIRTAHLAFVGRMLSGFTHELKNYLAIIKESSGLLQDLMDMGKLTSKKDSPTVLSSLKLIDEQVGRSIHIINHLNRFGHRMDLPQSTFNLHEALEEVMVLISRFAAQRKVRLERDFQKDIEATFTGDPARLQFVISCLLEEALLKLDSGGSLTVKTSVSEGDCGIRLIPKGVGPGMPSQQSRLPEPVFDEVIRSLNGEISRREDGETTVNIRLTR